MPGFLAVVLHVTADSACVVNHLQPLWAVDRSSTFAWPASWLVERLVRSAIQRRESVPDAGAPRAGAQSCLVAHVLVAQRRCGLPRGSQRSQV